MKNSVTCPNCNTENPFYNSNCSNCSNYLRDRIYNLDLWSIISLLIESPSKAFKKIIFAEHKNFIIFIFLFVSIKHLINVRFVSMMSLGSFNTTVELFYSYLFVSGILLIFVLLFSLLLKNIGRILNIFLRYNDILAVIIYSQIPFLFGIILFTLELIIFGDYLFSTNPSPFIIKKNLAYLFTGLEIAIILWSTFLLFKAIFVLTSKRLFSLFSTFIFSISFWSLIYFFSFIVFTI